MSYFVIIACIERPRGIVVYDETSFGNNGYRCVTKVENCEIRFCVMVLMVCEH